MHIPMQRGWRIKSNKYNAQRTVVDGRTFDSRKEANRYMELRVLERAGYISNLQPQVPFPFRVNNVLVCTYRADFVYERDGQRIVEDAKGVVTPVFRIKAKLMKAIYGIDVVIV